MAKKKQASEQKEVLVIDTSFLISNPQKIDKFDNKDVYLPIEVLEELDAIKIRMDKAGAAARTTIKFLDELRKNGSLSKGVELENKQKVFIFQESDLSLLPSGMVNNVDNKILATAVKLSQSFPKVKVITEDLALRVKADSLGLFSGTLEIDNTTKDFDEVKVMEIDKDQIDTFFKDGLVCLKNHGLSINQGVVLKSGQSSALGVVDSLDCISSLKFITKNTEVQGIRPRSKEQFFALEHLMNPEISLVTLTGMAGCGKTLLAIASALEHIQIGNYEKIVITRPAQSTSKDIGFLPGSAEEKLAPWLQPIMDNLQFILSDHGMSYIDMMKKKGILELAALAYIRGRTLPNTIFIIDEAQNITQHEAKALLTRMGENSKIVLIGDLDQIDSPSVTELTSGLRSVIQLFKDFDEAGHVHLSKGERSRLASYAAKVM